MASLFPSLEAETKLSYLSLIYKLLSRLLFTKESIFPVFYWERKQNTKEYYIIVT